ncbi:MAG: twin-arginine translocase subunit TatC [Deltaproteobacteria bacterium]|nr:twin-arginine translocase subunit TatC [Deltaproteobacteria bacterium]
MSEALPPPAPDEDVELERGAMPFRAHLVELRGRILRAALGIVVGFFVAWAYHVEIFDLLSAPIRAAMADNGLFAIKALQITESISVYMRIALIGGVFLSSPWIFWQVWAFVAPGLLRSEKRLAVPVIGASVLFFVAGAAFCYAVVLPFMTDFLIKMTIEAEGMTLEPTLASTTSYATWLLLAFGVVFELPVFMYFLALLEMVTAKGLLAFYRYWIVIAAVIGAILTPTPDPINQMLMSGPLVVLYGIGIGIAWAVEADRRGGGRIPVRGAVILVVLLLGAGAVGAREQLGRRNRDPVADVPRDALQLVGMHAPAMAKLLQQAGDDDAKRALGPLAMLEMLGVEVQGPQFWLVRMAKGAALIVPCADADAVPTRLSRERQSSLLKQSGGPSVQLRLPGEEGLWRVTAPQPDVLWIGHEDALVELAATRSGDRAALADDVRFAEQVEELRAAGPLWSIALSSVGVAGLLPGGALADRIERASAVLDRDGHTLLLRLVARSEADARSVRDRLAVWASEVRASAEPTPKTPSDDRIELLTRRLAAIAGLVGRVGETAARALPDGSSEQITLLAASHDAARLGRELRSVQPPEAPVARKDALAALVSPPAVFETSLRTATLSWKIEAPTTTLLEGIFAPTRVGLDPEGLKKKPEAGDADEAAAGAAAGSPGAAKPGDAKPADERPADEGPGPDPRRMQIPIPPPKPQTAEPARAPAPAEPTLAR